MTARRYADVTGSPADTAGEYRRSANRHYGYARTEAGRAAEFYAAAASQRRFAAWLTRRPDLWDDDMAPAGIEAAAVSYERIGDTFLDSSFRYVAQARDHSALARKYDQIAARRAASIAALAGQP
jgi:hypothetical protein